MAKHFSTGPIEQYFGLASNLQQFRRCKKELFESLSEREVQVLTLLGEGNNNPVIAIELGITRNTVQNHRASIREKLNISKQADFIKYALSYDLIQF